MLRRRALFLSAAVAASACGGGTPTSKDASVVKVQPVVGQPESDPARPPKRNPPTDASAPPPIEIPADASEEARRMYEHLKKSVARLQFRTATLVTNLLRCNLQFCQSDAVIELLAQWYSTTSHGVSELTPACRGSSPQAKAYERVVKEQQDFFTAQLEAYREVLIRRMDGDPDFPDRFDAALTRADAARPSVCLDCDSW